MNNTFEIKKDVYYVGVNDKDLEIFDIIMPTKYGTTYNSYLIKDEKIVLFDTVKENFKDEFFNNLKEVTDISAIDYVVVHHTEPDHSGALKYLLEINPEIEVICTKAAKLYLGGQINKEFKCHIIKDGEVINIGKRNLKFLATPYLHWVDTMFTYVEEDQLLFTCDAFGTHYASTDVDAVDGEDYKESVKFYFDCIVKPFSKYVLNAIDKVVDLGLKFDTILTSHGPILSKNPNYNIEKYLEWSNENISFVNQNKASIFYLSAYTNTKQMALTMEDYLKNQGLKAQSYDLEKLELHELHDIIVSSKVLLLGSPTINKSMVKPLWDLFSIIDPILNHGKIAGVFGSFGWSGEGITIAHNLVKSMNFKTPVEPLKKKFTPSTITFEDCEEFAHAFVEFLK